MKNVKLAIIFYSMTGGNLKMATWAKEEAERLGADVRLLTVEEFVPESVLQANPLTKQVAEAKAAIPMATEEDLEWADAILWSTPTRFGSIPSQMKQFIDTKGGLWAAGKTVNKVVSAMATAQNPHGGQEQTILAMYTVMYHWGAIVVTPGFSDASIFAAGGNPYGTSATVDEGKIIEDESAIRGAVAHQTKRLLESAAAFKAGRTE